MIDNLKAVLAREQLPDYLVLVNWHHKGRVMLDMVKARRVKTILLINDLSQDQKAEFGVARQGYPDLLGSLVSDNERAGYEMAQSLISAVRSKKGPQASVKLLALGGGFAAPAGLARLKGLQQAVQEEAGVTIDRTLTVLWSGEEAYRRTASYLRGQTPDAIWAASDMIAFGALRALDEQGLIPGWDVFVAGLHFSRWGVHEVRSGRMTMTHGGHFFGGAWVLVLLRDYHDGFDFADFTDAHTTNDPVIRFPMSAITPKMVDELIAKLDDWNFDKIDFARFSRSLNPEVKDYDFSIPAILRAIP